MAITSSSDGCDMNFLIGTLMGIFFLPALHMANVLAGFWVRRRLRHDLIRRARGRLVLTYDDGPSVGLDPRILEVLAKHQARATFFLLGLCAQGRTEAITRLTSLGHEIASHGFAHIRATTFPPWSVRQDQVHAIRVFSDLDVDVQSYRPPYGRMTASQYWFLRKNGLAPVFWTHDSGDTAGSLPNPAEVVDSVERDGGGVVLIHSHDRGKARERESYVLQVTEMLLEMAARLDLKVVTSSELWRE